MMFSNKFYHQNSDLLTYCVPTKAQKNGREYGYVSKVAENV